ncbi:MAG: hypothetical protein ACM3NQ_20870, partial [Bacteroidales bacterium]
RVARDHALWRLAGRHAWPSARYKRERLLRVGRLYGCSTFIETGTYLGRTVAAMQPQFDLVMSSELSPALQAGNQATLGRWPNVRLFTGDSATLLPEMVRLIQGRALFWLDAHYSGGATALGSKESPLCDELRAIAAAQRRDHCVLIDDARCCTGLDDYPTLSDLWSMLRTINPDYHLVLEWDCVMALPPMVDLRSAVNEIVAKT